MNKTIIIKFSILFLIIQNVNASGIPTIDIANIVHRGQQSIIRAQEFSEKIAQARERLNHYKEMVEGHFDYENIVVDPLINEHLRHPDWKQIYDDDSNIDDLRDEFEMHSDDPDVQEKYDRELKEYQAYVNYYDMSVKRNANLNNLLNEFAEADNPAAKADLANSILFENSQIDNDAQMMETMSDLMDKKAQLEHEQIIANKLKKLRNEGLEVDYSSASDF